jgi:hypothetical protein
MAPPLAPDVVDAVAARIAAGECNSVIAQALGLGRNSIAGIISRLRQRGDPRIPAAGTRGSAFRTVWQERDALADAWASGAESMTEAADLAGLAPSTAYRRWAEIVAALGPQAQ